jgi:solute carrier family 26 (sodium-independent sulfate anion transporter), member 11
MIDANDERPLLRAVVLDCSSVTQVDTTSIQALVDTRNQLDRHAAPEPVEWHLADVRSRWARRAFAAAGFGYPSPALLDAVPRWSPVYTVADTGAKIGAYGPRKHTAVVHAEDLESVSEDMDKISSVSGADAAPSKEARDGRPGRLSAVQGVNRPFMYLSVEDAVDSAVWNAQGRSGPMTGSTST